MENQGRSIRLIRKLAGVMLSLMIALAMMPFAGQFVYAEEPQADVTAGGVTYHLWYSDGGASVAVRKYNGSATKIKLPESVTYGGKTYKDGDNGFFFI